MEFKDIKKGFNQGYLLKKTRPELADKLAKGFQDKEHPWHVGFQKGYNEAAREGIIKKRNYEITKDQLPSKDQTKDKTQSKGDREI